MSGSLWTGVKALCGVCEAVISPILRSDESAWEDHVAAVHGVTAVLEVNKEVGAWLLRQESIFWSAARLIEPPARPHLAR